MAGTLGLRARSNANPRHCERGRSRPEDAERTPLRYFGDAQSLFDEVIGEVPNAVRIDDDDLLAHAGGDPERLVVDPSRCSPCRPPCPGVERESGRHLRRR
jgi:hypothetical protein